MTTMNAFTEHDNRPTNRVRKHWPEAVINANLSPDALTIAQHLHGAATGLAPTAYTSWRGLRHATGWRQQRIYTAIQELRAAGLTRWRKHGDPGWPLVLPHGHGPEEEAA